MKAWTAALAVVALVACRSPGSTPIPEARADEPVVATTGGVAVVELFTSEGCSSCPPADAVLADLARQHDRPVYVMAFHVDYWDDLGWPDRFASHDSTQRQQAYARAFGSRGLYTPQMIVGGSEQFTGSDRDHASAAITRALARTASVRLTVRPRAPGPTVVAVDYEAQGATAGASITVAVVEHSATTSVRAGENAGKTLHHANVVRGFVTAPATSSGVVAVPVPASLVRDDAEVIAFVQRASDDGSGMPVLGAARAPLVRR